MAKLDRLGWAAGLSFVSYGVHLGIRVNDLGVLERMAVCLPPSRKRSASPVVDELCSLVVAGTARSPSVRRYNLLYWGTTLIARTLDREELFAELESLLNFIVATRARRKVFVRAGVVGWGGHTVMICGPSCSGKTTLVEAFVRAGATYYSDRYAVLDARGRIHPYPTWLTFSNPAGGRRCALEMLVGRSGLKPLPVGFVILTEYRPGARWRPRRLTAGQATLALLTNTEQARLRPQLALTTLRLVASGATILQGKRGEADDMVARLLHHLSPGCCGQSRSASARPDRGKPRGFYSPRARSYQAGKELF